MISTPMTHSKHTQWQWTKVACRWLARVTLIGIPMAKGKSCFNFFYVLIDYTSLKIVKYIFQSYKSVTNHTEPVHLY